MSYRLGMVCGETKCRWGAPIMPHDDEAFVAEPLVHQLPNVARDSPLVITAARTRGVA